MTVHVVVPCFNEARRWNRAYWEDMKGVGSVRLLFVDDGSKDDTRVAIERHCRGDEVQGLFLRQNFGKAEAVRAGLLQALADSGPKDCVAFLDADGAFSVQDVGRLIDLSTTTLRPVGEFDAVWSSRVALAGRSIHRSPGRHYLGRAAATAISWRQDAFPYDTQSGFKIFAPSEVLRKIIGVPFQTRWLFEVEMLSRFRAITNSLMNVWEEPLTYWNDVPGSTVTMKEFIRFGAEILKIRGYGSTLRKLQHPRNW